MSDVTDRDDLRVVEDPSADDETAPIRTEGQDGELRPAERDPRSVGEVLRAVLGNRDGVAALVLTFMLVYALYEIAVLRRSSATGPSAGILAFVAVQLVIVACTVALAAHGVNPLAGRFEEARRRVRDALSVVDELNSAIQAAMAAYDAVLDEIRAVGHEAVQHVAVIADHVDAVNRIWVDSIRSGQPEPTTEHVLGGAELPVAHRPADPVAFIREGWIDEVDGLPSALDADEQVER